MSLTVRHWGTRGSISTPGAARAEFGACTACVTVSSETGTLILDAGYGIANYGDREARLRPLATGQHSYHLFLTHFHWDHIQGLPFFPPTFFAGNDIHIWSPLPEDTVRAVLDHLFDGSYTPFDGLASLPCRLTIERLGDVGEAQGFTVRACPTAHAGPTFAYRVEAAGRVVVYAPDHDAARRRLNDRLLDFAQGADLLIHDATFTDAEYAAGADWGHSALSTALRNARLSGARATHFTHHLPLRSDAELTALEAAVRQQLPSVRFAREYIDYTV